MLDGFQGCGFSERMEMLFRAAILVLLCGLPVSAPAQEVRFSRSSGGFVEPFPLSLSVSSSSAVIHYIIVTNAAQASATQTNVPSTNSPVYSGPIPIGVTTQIRARAFEAGRPPGPPVSETFIQVSSTVAGFNSDVPLVIVHNWAATPSVISSSSEQSAVIATFDLRGDRSSLASEANLVARAGIHDLYGEEEGQPKPNIVATFWDEFNQKADRPLLGMPADSDWLFHGINGFDPGLMHNAIFHWLGRQVGRYSSRTRYVEVFLKTSAGPVTSNDYRGLYLIEEIPKRSPYRVDITPIELQDTNLPAISGGYQLRIDRNLPADRMFPLPGVPGVLGSYSNLYGGQSIILDEPKGPDLVTDPRRASQLNFIRTYFTNFIFALAGAGFTNPITGYAAYIDVDSWIDNHIVNAICHNVDAYRLHSYLFKDRGKRIEQGPSWDCDRCLGTGGSGANAPQIDNRCFNPRQWRVPTTDIAGDVGTDFFGRSVVGINWWDRLFRDPDFWQHWIDRYQSLRANALADGLILGLVDDLHGEIKEAQVREQTRWSTNFNFPRWGSQTVNGYTFDFGPRNPAFAQGGYYTNEVNFQKRWLLDRLDFIDTNFLAMPQLTLSSGMVNAGTVVGVTGAEKLDTLIVYTLDGTDPRLPGGAVSPNAHISIGDFALTISNNVGLFARCYNTNHFNVTDTDLVGNPPLNSFWSGPATGIYYTAVPPLRITEVMYHAPDQAHDFIEVKNTGDAPLNLAGFRLRGDVQFRFPELILGAGQHAVVAANVAAFQLRYGPGISVAGAYSGSLPDDDGHLILEGPVGEPILNFTYHDKWRPMTDGLGFSLVAIDENAAGSNWSQASQWRQSGVIDGTPGATDPGGPALPAIFVNELQVDAVGLGGDSVELYNPAENPTDIGGWFLTDDFGTPKKFRIADGTTVPANGYFLLQQADSFGVGPGALDFDSEGGQVFLFSADASGDLTGWMHGFEFGASSAGTTFGRHVISSGEDRFVTQIAPTLGAANSGPRVGPIVVSEIVFHPPALQVRQQILDNGMDEFIELHNISGSPVPLYDPVDSDTTWRLRGAVGFTFPAGAVIPAGGFLLVVGFDPADNFTLDTFRTVSHVTPGTPVYGPWTGRLDNSQGNVELVRPDSSSPSSGSTRYVVADQVVYQNTSPWPEGANGTGASITRIIPASFGDDPANWRASVRTPGAANPGGSPPELVTEPSDTIGVENSTVSLAVLATGAGPLGYQWFFNDQAIYGAVNPVLTLTNLQFSQAGSYACVVVGAGGVVQSREASLTVRRTVRIFEHPAAVTLRGSTNDVDYGFTTNHATFRVAASSSTPMHFQWRFNGVPIPGANLPSLVVSNVGLSADGLYDVAVTDDVSTVFGGPARLTVLVNPSIQIPPPLHIEVITGATFTVSASVRGNPLPFGFQWLQASTPRASNTVFATSAFATLTAPSSLVTNQSWRFVVRNAATLPAPANYQFFVTTRADQDGDGLPDVWESAFGFSITNSADRDLDADNDGMSNWAEYIAGTDPTNRLSYLRIEPPLLSGQINGVILRFFAMSNRTYSVESSDALPNGLWTRVAEIVARPTNGEVVVSDPRPRLSQRVYRLATPRTN